MIKSYLNKGISTPVAILIILILAILVRGFIYWQYLEIRREETGLLKIEIPEKVDETADWKTYRNEEYGFEIRYPSNVLITEQESYNLVDFSVVDAECKDPRLRCPPPFMSIGSIYIPSDARDRVSPESTLEELIKESLMLEEFKEFHVTPEESNWDIDVIEKVAFGAESIQGYLVHGWAQAHGACRYYGKEKSYSIQIIRSGGGLTYSECENDPLFNQMLHTLRFIEPGITDWKNYENVATDFCKKEDGVVKYSSLLNFDQIRRKRYS